MNNEELFFKQKVEFEKRVTKLMTKRESLLKERAELLATNKAKIKNKTYEEEYKKFEDEMNKIYNLEIHIKNKSQRA